MKFGSLFAGIGGFDLGLERAAMECAWQVEIDRRCTNVLEAHWPDVERWRDVRDCGRDNLGTVDLICGGFPCQDVSLAGRRAGLAGERSGLWWEFHRIIGEIHPRWCVVENVPGLLSSNRGRDMGAMLWGLAELGYGWAYRVLDAQYFGLAQRRRRVFIVGHLGDARRAAQVLFEPESCKRNTPPSKEQRARIAAPLTRGSATARGGNDPGRRREDDVNLVASPLLAHEGQRYNVGEDTWIVARPLAHSSTLDHYDESQQSYVVGFSKASHPLGSEELAEPVTTRHGDPGCVAFAGMAQAASGGFGVRRLTPVECERLQGFPDGWTEHYPIGGQSDSSRYRQLGNAVAVSVVEWIGRRIMRDRQEDTDDAKHGDS